MEGYLSDEYVFVYLQTRSGLLRDPDCLRELSLDLSKKNRSDQVSSLELKKGHRSKFASAVLPTLTSLNRQTEKLASVILVQLLTTKKWSNCSFF